MASPENEGKHELHSPRAHNPAAPLDESFDLPSTVDPSYLISLIRRLLPSDVKASECATDSGSATDKLKSECGIKDVTRLVESDVVKEMEYSDRHDDTKHIVDNDADQDSSRHGNGNGSQGGSAVEEIWEECGCILWDLSASEEHAQFMVENLILEVLLANLMVSQSSRVTEICLGILGNVACHESLQDKIPYTNGLVQVIVEQLLLDDVPILCETCRVLTSCLRGNEGVTWAKTLQAEPLISRILWIAENTLNLLLLSKIADLLLAILESPTGVSSLLLPPLIKLDFSSLLVKLLEFEIGKLREKSFGRHDVLDLILRAIEALSTIDTHSREVCLDRRLWALVKEMVELPDKLEVSSSCLTAAVIIANILTESDDFALLLSEDVVFLQGLFDVLPFASGDNEAKNAIWSIIARLLALFQEKEISPPTLHSLVTVLSSKTELIEDELLDSPLQATSMTKIDPRTAAVKRIPDILLQWRSMVAKEEAKLTFTPFNINNEDVDKLLQICQNL